MHNFLLRPIEKNDISGLHNLVKSMKSGLSSLPDNRAQLQKRIQLSLDSFSKSVSKPGLESYLFVLEDTEKRDIIGVSGIHATTALSASFYVFERFQEAIYNKDLKVSKNLNLIRLKEIKSTFSEVCSLYLHKKSRGLGLGPLLSFSRYLFMVNHPERFYPNVIANLRGFRNKEGFSPFWRVVGQSFLEKKLAVVDTMKALGNKAFIKDLMPKYPIYTHLLPKDAQDCIGKLHKNTQPAHHLLIEQGFHEMPWIDLFDAATYLTAPLSELHITQKIKHTHLAHIKENAPSSQKKHLIATPSLDFRAILAPAIQHKNSGISLHQKDAKILNLKPNSVVNLV